MNQPTPSPFSIGLVAIGVGVGLRWDSTGLFVFGGAMLVLTLLALAQR